MRSHSPVRGFVLLECGIVGGGLAAMLAFGPQTGTVLAGIVIGVAASFVVEWAWSEWLFRREMCDMLAVMSSPEWRTNTALHGPMINAWFPKRRGLR